MPSERALSPWVLRHARPVTLCEGSELPRRELHTGATILSDRATNGGLEITSVTLLPFLLAGRAQGLVAASSKGRALFADGLASSFEAYLETRTGSTGVDEDADTDTVSAGDVSELQWYLGHLDKRKVGTLALRTRRFMRPRSAPSSCGSQAQRS